MGTRSLTKVFDGDFLLLTLYRQYDGYVSGHGAELLEFLAPTKMVNGISSVTFMDAETPVKERIANGAGCLAAQLVAYFKKESGGFYIVNGLHADHGQEYEYEVRVDRQTNAIALTVIEVWPERLIIFAGDITEYTKFVAGEGAA